MSTPPISGYVLAGGRSSRMRTDKSLLLLAGKPLIQQAVTKLGRVCAEVHILSANPALAAYAPLIPDIHPGCGPIGGMEAALAHSPARLDPHCPGRRAFPAHRDPRKLDRRNHCS